MKRFQAIEWEDYRWFPSWLRDSMTDFYQFQMTRFNLYAPVADLMAPVLRKTGKRSLVDMCSGGSGPLMLLQQQLKKKYGMDVEVTLTDKFPNLPAFEKVSQASDGAIGFASDSVDALAVPEKYEGMRTIFSAFHHFRPKYAKAMLQDSVNQQRPIGVFELSNRSPSAFVQVMLYGPISLFFLTPFFRPFRWSRIIFTYLIPLIPFLCMWDGVGSNLRAYSPEELQGLVDQLDNADTFDWKIGIVPGDMQGVEITYLMGIPKS